MDKLTALDRLIRPKTIAVFGGSWAHSVVEQCLKMGYKGELWPVHPTRDSVLGLKCYASIDHLPNAPDVSFLGVNRDTTIELVAKLANAGAGGAVCFAAGFSEAAAEDERGIALEHALLEAAGSMPVLGPNCYGFINCLDRALLWPDQHGTVPVSSGVAIVTQSSNIAINMTMQTRGLPIAYVFTAGNQASVSLAQLAMTALKDERVSAVGLHIEGFGSVRDFEELAALAKTLGKSIVAIKVGKSAAAQQALKSHTSSLAGSDASANAFLKRLGIARVHSVAVFLEVLKLLHAGGALSSRRLLSMSCSGGEACLMGDAAVEQNLLCPPLNEKQHKSLREALGPRVALANPLDYHTYIWNDRQAMQAMFAGMLETDAAIAILVLDFPRVDRCEYDSWLVAIDAFKAAGAKWSGQLAVLASMPENMPEFIAEQLMDAGIVPLCGLDDAMMAIAAASEIAPDNQVSNAAYKPVLLCADHVKTVPEELISLEEAVAKKWLSSNHIKVPQGIVLSGQALSANYLEEQCQLLEWPVVLKRTDSLHKSDTGGVVLNIENVQQLQVAIDTMRASPEKTLTEASASVNLSDKHTDTSYLVEEQVQTSVCELLVGIVRDPVHGFLFTVGAGGVQAELLSDTASALLPLDRDELYWLLAQLRCFAVLEGYRGNAGCDMEALLDTLIKLQTAAISVANELHELEVNPLLCNERGAVAVDALLRVSPQASLSEFSSDISSDT